MTKISGGGGERRYFLPPPAYAAESKRASHSYLFILLWVPPPGQRAASLWVVPTSTSGTLTPSFLSSSCFCLGVVTEPQRSLPRRPSGASHARNRQSASRQLHTKATTASESLNRVRNGTQQRNCLRVSQQI